MVGFNILNNIDLDIFQSPQGYTSWFLTVAFVFLCDNCAEFIFPDHLLLTNLKQCGKLLSALDFSSVWLYDEAYVFGCCFSCYVHLTKLSPCQLLQEFTRNIKPT